MSTRRRAHFTGQADLAKSDETFGQGFATQTAGDGQHDRQIGRRLTDAHTAYRVHKHILVHAGHARMAVQNGQQHGQAIPVQAHTQAPWRRATTVHQRLNLHQQRAGAFERDHHAAAGHRLGVLAQKDGARVAHALQALFGHSKHANFVHRAKAVLDGTDQAEIGMRIAFKVQHRVHHVLQHAGASQRALFGDVADQHDGDAGRFGGARQMRGAFAHLRHRAGGAGQLV